MNKPKSLKGADKVYFISDLELIKIGYTANTVNERLHQLSTGSAKRLYVLGYIDGDFSKEKELHKQFEAYRVRQNGEWFYPSQSLIDYINSNNQDNIYVELDENTNKLFFYNTMSLA